MPPVRWNMGLSPHARGNQRGFYWGLRPLGPIPACAGEPIKCFRDRQKLGAYPRMRGGTRFCSDDNSDFEGLSPHARGNPKRIACH